MLEKAEIELRDQLIQQTSESEVFLSALNELQDPSNVNSIDTEKLNDELKRLENISVEISKRLNLNNNLSPEIKKILNETMVKVGNLAERIAKILNSEAEKKDKLVKELDHNEQTEIPDKIKRAEIISKLELLGLIVDFSIQEWVGQNYLQMTDVEKRKYESLDVKTIQSTSEDQLEGTVVKILKFPIYSINNNGKKVSFRKAKIVISGNEVIPTSFRKPTVQVIY